MADDYGFHTVSPEFGSAMFLAAPPPDNDKEVGWYLEWACPKCGLGHSESGHEFEVGSNYEIKCDNDECDFVMTGEVVLLDL